jgi:hypothetical protein
MSFPLDDDLLEPAQGWRERGLIVEESVLSNTVTGERFSIAREHLTLVDPITGSLGCRDREFLVQCSCGGDVITQPELLAFCGECSGAVCTRHSVVDTMCGRIICNQCSRMIEVNGLTLRLCRRCYDSIRMGWLRRLFRRLMGRE